MPRAAAECGNGVLDEGEACDLGFANAPQGPCRDDCRAPRCGDGIADEGERCDDGNDDDHDGCRSDCTRPLQSVWVRAPMHGELDATVHGITLVPEAGALVVGEGQPQTGAPRRAWLARYDVTGSPTWSQWLPLDEGLEQGWEAATARAVAIDGAGDLWIAGYVRGTRHDDVWIARCDPEGVPRWSHTQDFGGDRDRAVAIVVDDQGALVAGEVVQHAEDRDGLVLAIDADGVPQWTWRHDGPAGGIDDARAIAATPDGGVVVGGGEDDLTAWWLAKLERDGDFVGVSRRRGQVGAWVSAIAVEPQAGDLWVAGTEVLDAPDPGDPSTWHAQPWLARLDAAGEVRWLHAEPPSGAVRREVHALVLDPEVVGGGATIVGTDPIPDATCARRFCPARLWAASFDGLGRRRWWAVPEEMIRGEGRAVAREPDGTLWLGGSRRLVFSQPDAWLARMRERPGAEPTGEGEASP